MAEPMTDERLKELEQYANTNNYNQGRLAETCQEIWRLRAENMRLENALDEATENVRRMHEAKDD